VLWRWHISHFPEGVPAYEWLFNGNGIRFKGAWFWWLFAERIAKLILGGWGVSLLLVGLVTRPQIADKNRKNPWLFHFWMLGMLLYLIVFATGNVQHDYYQVILVPILSIFLGIGVNTLLTKSNYFHTWLSKLLVGIAVLFMLMFGWYQARDFFNINHPEIVAAGGEFDRLVPYTHVTVIAPYGGDTAFLYQTGRRGWPLMEGTIEQMIEKGAHYYISTTFDETTNELIETAQLVSIGKGGPYSYKVLKQTDTYVIIQLVPDHLLPKN
jgi:hypothetical protein